MAWAARVLTLFPEMFPGHLGHSLAGRALEAGIWSLDVLDIRDYSEHKHRSVDDAPFGGGAGMVMRPDVVDAALRAATADGRPGAVICLSARGRLLDQARVRGLVEQAPVVLLCGRFEGIDQRVLDAHAVEEVSIGDVVLSGGEPAALCLLDAVVRLLPGVMGNRRSGEEESFAESSGGLLLEYPQFTRPAEWTGPDGEIRAVPDVLLSGHHDRVRAWRETQAEAATATRRPELFQRYRRRDQAGKRNQDQQD